MRSSFGKRLTKLYILKMCWWIAAGFIIPFFPIYIAYNIGISITSISLTIEVMLIISMILSICLIKVMSIYNKKLIIVAGMVYLIIYSVILIVNRNAFIPIILMMLFSISYSILITVPLSIVYKLIPAQMRGTILGVDNIFLNLPQALSIGMAGIVYILFGINYIYIISVVFSIITIILLISYNINEPM
jgi:MFS family permease